MKDELPEAWFVVDDNIVNSLQVGERGKSIGSDVKIFSSGQPASVLLKLSSSSYKTPRWGLQLL